MTKNVLKGAALAGAALTLGLLSAAPAQSLTLSYGAGGNNTAKIDGSADAGQSFTIHFNGLKDGTPVPGLKADALFTFNGFQTVGTGANLKTEALFDVLLTNKSVSPITASRISGLGFNIDPNAFGVGSNNAGASTRITNSGTVGFTNDSTGNVPDGIGKREVCFSASNCAGGANGGVTFGNSGTFSYLLGFNGNVTSFTLSDFFVRYQSIQGAGDISSAVGVGRVPTPALLPGLLALGAGVLRKRKQAQAAEVEVDA